MLLDLLERLQEIFKSCKVKLTEEQLNNLKELLEWHSGGIIPSSVVKRELKISYNEVHSLMIFLMTKGIVKSKYKVYCENDNITGTAKVYDDPAEIPITICDRCDKGCSLINNIVVEFEVCI